MVYVMNFYHLICLSIAHVESTEGWGEKCGTVNDCKRTLVATEAMQPESMVQANEAAAVTFTRGQCQRTLTTEKVIMGIPALHEM